MDEGLDGLMGAWIDKQICRDYEVLCSGCSRISMWVQQAGWKKD